MDDSPLTQPWAQLAARIHAALHLSAPPIAITFSVDPPRGVDRFSDPMPSPAPDGRTGRVPAGCVFWVKSVDRTFATVREDHGNCSVGSVTHGLQSLDEVMGNDDLSALVQSGWADHELVAGLTTVSGNPGAVTYGPLADTPFDPDVVLMRLNAKGLMVLSDALPGLRVEGKPQCHIVAEAKENDQTVASVGCMLSRTRTAMPSDEMTCAVPAPRLQEVVARLERTAEADAAVAAYAADDARRFS